MQNIKKSIYSWISQRYMNGCSSYNNLDVRKSCRSKEQARAVFSQGNVPHAKGLIFLSPFKAHSFAKTHGFPLVIKPNVSGYSRGSYFPINNFFELWKAIFLAKLWWPTTVVEQYLKGHNYRVVAIKGEIMSVIERYPPTVTGDGLQTISKLIDEENAIRKEMNLYPCIHPIEKNEQTISFLKKRQYSLDTIPAQGEDVILFYRISLAPGGTVRTIDKATIPEINRQLFVDVLDMFGANILGIDVIFEKGIEHAYQDQQCIFLEVNSRPYLKMHDYPRFGEKEDLSPYYSKLNKLDISNADTY
ncbi:cyanophycin synthetase [Neptunomonas antarctica]|uniref:Cyanophycin synthetase n=1 Tax=Neptunomonas antarctica TaxID=619304 RepID=A0A1N7NH77_9GAMM|nr:cyanophycin synthetase [Neptunomonas antarctica]SIS97667.1 cyanophycin synthetase [Neptunomonas antarctica]